MLTAILFVLAFVVGHLLDRHCLQSVWTHRLINLKMTRNGCFSYNVTKLLNSINMQFK